MSNWNGYPRGESGREPWSGDPDAWRGEKDESALLPLLTSWPQLDATPLYWMWCERLERERGIDQSDTP